MSPPQVWLSATTLLPAHASPRLTPRPHTPSQAVEAVCAAAAGGAPVVVAVLGPKGVGKSSLARLTANRLLDVAPTVAFLDSDVGQPEFSPPGLLSLHLLDGAAPTAAGALGASGASGSGGVGMAAGGPVVGPPHVHSRPAWASRFVVSGCEGGMGAWPGSVCRPGRTAVGVAC